MYTFDPLGIHQVEHLYEEIMLKKLVLLKLKRIKRN